METPPVPATLAYERQNEQLRAEETAAVWRVAWWIGLLWSFGTILVTCQTVWSLFSGGWAESRLAELPFGSSAAALSVLQCAGAVAMTGALLANTRRRVIAILATLMSLLLLLTLINELLLSGVYFERSFHLVWLAAIVVRMLLWGGILVVAMAAWWPGWVTPRGLFAAVAVLLLGEPVGQLIDPVYWWLARGEPVGQVLRGQFSSQDWPSMLQAGVLLLVSVLLVVMSTALRKWLWLLWLVALAAILCMTLYDFVHVYRAFDAVFWTNDAFARLLSMTARILRDNAPVLGLLAWRPVSHVNSRS